jgi:hypothetical protein
MIGKYEISYGKDENGRNTMIIKRNGVVEIESSNFLEVLVQIAKLPELEWEIHLSE